MKTATKFLLLLTFFGFFTFFSAQESKEILELKAKLKQNLTDIERVKILDGLGDEYGKLYKIDSTIIYYTKALPIQKKLNNNEMVGRSYLFFGIKDAEKNDIINAEKNFLEAEKYLHKSENYDKRALLNFYLAQVNGLYKRNDVALKYYNENLKYYHQNKKFDRRIILNTYQGIFANNFIKNDLTDSYKSLNTYIDFTKKNYPEYLYQAYRTAGAFYMNSIDYQKSLEYFNKALDEADKRKNKSQIADAKTFIGYNYSKLNNNVLAKKNLKESEEYYTSQNMKQNLPMVYFTLSDIYEREKDFEQAEFYINKTVELSGEKDPMYNQYKNVKGTVLMKKLMLDSLDLKKNPEKRKELQNLIDNQLASLKNYEESKTFVHPEVFIQNYKILQRAYAFLDDYEKSYFYLNKYSDKREKTYDLEKMKDFSNTQSNYELREQKAKIEFQEQSKRLQLQKEIELKALKFEYDKKQAAAKTEAERKRLMLEENLKRKEIQIKFDEEQKAITLKYNQEKQLAKINQEKKDAVAKAELESSKSEKNMWAIGAGLSLLLLGFAGFSYFQKQKDNKKIAEEKQKSDDLLLNILPHEVAEELKEKGKTSAKHYDEVSVLFTDFVSFTANSEKLGVQEVLNELNICFTEFDRIMEKNGLEKIKTIGDAYLAVSGLPVSNEQHAKNAVNAGLEILEFIEKRKKQSPNTLDIRIGVHSGPVIAGIVGVKKFAYDIWGDTVNTAARMEQNSAKGKLNISGSTYDLVKEKFTCEYRGKIETKGKGALDMYFVSEHKGLI